VDALATREASSECCAADLSITRTRCWRDAALDGRGYIVVLDDADLIGLLRAVGDGNRIIIDGFLNSRLGLLLT
jgi:hypothetical protein